jgi:nicotinamidase/pyrazinamidase
VVGIATDYCVRATAADAVAAGLRTRVLLGLTVGVDPRTTAESLDALRAAGVELIPASSGAR